MLINPNRVQLATIQGTRILEETFGLSGFQFIDPRSPRRLWVLQYLYAPIKKRRLGGIRAKFTDTKGFVSFCNQRDLEVILGIASPGARCYWADVDYAELGDPGWFGLCVDDEDLEDDLLERELRLREYYTGIMPSGLEILRRFHTGGSDYEELLTLLQDADPITGYGPDPRLETINRRWARVEKVPLQWSLVET